MKVHNSSEYWVEKDGRGCEGIECKERKGREGGARPRVDLSEHVIAGIAEAGLVVHISVGIK